MSTPSKKKYNMNYNGAKEAKHHEPCMCLPLYTFQCAISAERTGKPWTVVGSVSKKCYLRAPSTLPEIERHISDLPTGGDREGNKKVHHCQGTTSSGGD